MRYLKILIYVMVWLVPQALLAQKADGHPDGESAPAKSIVILYENDVHCSIDGYTRIAGLRDAINRSDTAWAAVVCSGDFLQGNTIGALSHGQYIVDVMRHVGYDAITLGNHEFDYGITRMKGLLARLGAENRNPQTASVTCANFYDAGAPSPYYAPYVMRQYGKTKVAFVGALTPETMVLEESFFYDDMRKRIGDLCRDDFYTIVQQAVDDARSAGADYVVLLSHIGEKTQSMGFSSHWLVKNTRGIDIVLDGHTHKVVPGVRVENADGKPVTVTQTGTQFAHIGKMVITPYGQIGNELLPIGSVPYESPEVTAAIDSIREMTDSITSREVAVTGFRLEAADEKGKWVVRNRETNLGDLVADAYRYMTDADIAFENGGGLRNGIEAGRITYGDIIGVLPYDNHICLITATGQEILHMLQRCTAVTPKEEGNFPHCSGIRYTIHTGSHTVGEVEVELKDGQWVPIDLQRSYRVALTQYAHHDGGLYNTLTQCPVITESTEIYYDVLTRYLQEVLEGRVPQKYAVPQGRITIVDN